MKKLTKICRAIAIISAILGLATSIINHNWNLATIHANILIALIA